MHESGLKTYDLIIFGAGPAGLSTAMHLLQADPSWAERMVIFEKAAHPRHKLCGGGVTQMGLSVLLEIGLSLPLPLPQAQVNDVRLTYRGCTIHVHGEPMITVFHRQELDAYLAAETRKRGVKILENVTVERIKIDAGGVTVLTLKCAYRVAAAVGADGSNGAARRLVRRYENKSKTARLLERVSPGSNAKFVQQYALFDFSQCRENLQGYFWDFPSRFEGKPVYNRGIYDARMADNRSKADLPRLLKDHLLNPGGSAGVSPFEGHPIHWFTPSNRFLLPRLLRVGDAAGAEPLFGEGIAPGLAYGQVAAQALQAAFEEEIFSFRDYRQRLLSSPLGGYLLVRWLTGFCAYRFCHREWSMKLLWQFGKVIARAGQTQKQASEYECMHDHA